MINTYIMNNAFTLNATWQKVHAIATPASRAEIQNSKAHFGFNFYTLSKTNFIYKLADENQPAIIQALVAFAASPGVLACANMETNLHNRDKPGLYANTGKATIALCCKYSIDNGMDGFITFEAKNRLIPYYTRMGAYVVAGNRMVIGENEAKKLIALYF